MELGSTLRRNNHSRENTAPASGVPNTEAKPPATPQIKSIRTVAASKDQRLPSWAANAAPICRAVPSRPAEPPKRWVIKVPNKTKGAIRKGRAGWGV